MKLCLDEHYSRRIASDLRDRGYDVDCVKERAELIELSDGALLSKMKAERRAILTENVVDFMPLVRALIASGESHHGMLFTSNRSMPRHSGTIGLYVETLDRLMRRYPGDDDFLDRVEWLTP